MYIGALFGGFVVNLLLFPSVFEHVLFRYRGREALTNYLNRDFSRVWDFYYQTVNNSLFGGCLLIILLAGILVFIASLIINYRRNKTVSHLFGDNNNAGVLFKSAIFFTVTLFFLIVTKSSELLHNRYIYPIYPFLALLITDVIFYALQIIKAKSIQNVVAVLVCVILCVLSVYKNGIDFLYLALNAEKDRAERIKGYDCLLYFNNNWQDMYSDLPIKLYYDETRALRDHEIAQLPRILAERKTYNQVVINIPDTVLPHKRMSIIKAILAATDFEEYEYIYHYGVTNAYLLKRKD